jgi:hypothetical protein
MSMLFVDGRRLEDVLLLFVADVTEEDGDDDDLSPRFVMSFRLDINDLMLPLALLIGLLRTTALVAAAAATGLGHGP